MLKQSILSRAFPVMDGAYTGIKDFISDSSFVVAQLRRLARKFLTVPIALAGSTLVAAVPTRAQTVRRLLYLRRGMGRDGCRRSGAGGGQC